MSESPLFTKSESKSSTIERLSRLGSTTIFRYPIIMLLLLLVVGVLSSLQQQTFFTGPNLLNIARTFSWLAIAAFGESMVIIIGGIDLSVGAVMGLAGLISALCMQVGLPVPLAIVAGLATGGLAGWLNGSIVAHVKLPPFIVTLGTMSVVRGLTHGLSGGWSVTDLPQGFRLLGQNDLLLGPIPLPLPFLCVLGAAVLVSLLTNQTLLGRYIYALADSEQALIISGVNVTRVKVVTYTLCSLLAATGGLLMTARLGVATPTAATGYELDIIVAAVIGGTSLFGGKGSTLGVLLGAAFIQVLRNGLVLLGFPTYWQEAAMGAMILLTISFDYWRREKGLTWNWKGDRETKGRRTAVSRTPMPIRRGVFTFLIPAALLLGAVVVWQILGTLSDSLSPSESPSRPTLTIAWVPKARNNPVFELGRQGAIQKAAELSASGPVQVNVLYMSSVSSDAAEQVRVIEDVIARQVDAIAVSCNDPIACSDPIDKAVAAGIPVMTWDSDSPQSQRFTYLGIDNYEAGQAAADLLVRAMGRRGKIAILTGVPGAHNLEERVRGFADGIAPYPEIQVVATVISNDDINLGVQVVEETMQAHPDLDGWFFVGMWSLVADRGSMPLWEEAALRGDLKTVAFDTLPVELELLRDGYLSGLVGQKYWGWGYDTVQIVYDHIVEGKAYPSFISSGMDIVTQNNVEAMLWAWETNDFSQPLPDPY
jgi:ribose transport system substrate-binding protein